MIIGDSKVGKTSVNSRFAYWSFNSYYILSKNI